MQIPTLKKTRHLKEHLRLGQYDCRNLSEILQKFTTCFTGDRRFSPWKGSVVDSVVGVFLTQNVSDHLSR